VLDESHAIKNPESKSAKAIIELSTLAVKKIIISGTPVANKPEDLWNQFFFLDTGQLLGKDFKIFKSRYLTDLKDAQSILKSGKFEDLKKLIESRSEERRVGKKNRSRW